MWGGKAAGLLIEPNDWRPTPTLTPPENITISNDGNSLVDASSLQLVIWRV